MRKIGRAAFRLKTFFLVALLIPLALFAQEAGFEEVDLGIFMEQLLNSIGGFSGLGVMGMVATGVQLLMLLSKTKLSKFAGKYRLLIVYGLTMISGVLSLVAFEGLDIATAILHSNTLASIQVFGHQVVKQVKKPSEPKEEPAKG